MRNDKPGVSVCGDARRARCARCNRYWEGWKDDPRRCSVEEGIPGAPPREFPVMTLRDLLALRAPRLVLKGWETASEIAEASYAYADAMLVARGGS